MPPTVKEHNMIHPLRLLLAPSLTLAIAGLLIATGLAQEKIQRS
jgi:hypothetical protein